MGRSIQCPYHAWTYGLDGRLLGAPDMDHVEGFDRTAHPLHRAGIASWEGFLFVRLSDDGAPFETAFAPLMSRFARFGIPAEALPRRERPGASFESKFQCAGPAGSGRGFDASPGASTASEATGTTASWGA